MQSVRDPTGYLAALLTLGDFEVDIWGSFTGRRFRVCLWNDPPSGAPVRVDLEDLLLLAAIEGLEDWEPEEFLSMLDRVRAAVASEITAETELQAAAP